MLFLLSFYMDLILVTLHAALGSSSTYNVCIFGQVNHFIVLANQSITSGSTRDLCLNFFISFYCIG